MSKTDYRLAHSLGALIASLVATCLLLAGCEGLSGERATEIEADRTLRSLSHISPVDDPNIGLPEEYAAPPRIVKQMVGGGPEYKLLYFAKYHTPESLKQIIDNQYAQRNYDAKNRVSRAPAYITSINPACNQLIVRCPNEPDINATLQLLDMVDVPPVQVKINCLIYEFYADLTVDRETTILIQNLLGEGITFGGKEESGTLLPAFPGAALREVARSTFGLKIGYISGKEGHWFQTLADILESKGYLKIVMNPTLEVVNGTSAKITSSEKVPWQTITIETTSLGSQTYDRYEWIVDELFVTPHVFADGSIALQTEAMISSKSTPEGVKQTPILTKRQISNKENRVRHGESLVIGGMKKTERRAIVRGVPGLKDIPVIGMLFSSKDFEERAKETVFVLTPTISTGGIPNKKMVEKIRKMHEPPVSSDTLHEAVADPFGFKAGQRQEQRELLESEQALLKAQQESSMAQSAIDAADAKSQRALTQASRTAAELKRTKEIAQKMKSDAEKANAEAEAMLKEAEAARVKAADTTGDATKIKAEAERLTRQAQQAKEHAETLAKAAEAAMAKVKTAETDKNDAKKEKNSEKKPDNKSEDNK